MLVKVRLSRTDPAAPGWADWLGGEAGGQGHTSRPRIAGMLAAAVRPGQRKLAEEFQGDMPHPCGWSPISGRFAALAATCRLPGGNGRLAGEGGFEHDGFQRV